MLVLEQGSVPKSVSWSEWLWVQHAPMRGPEPALVLELMPMYEQVSGPSWEPELVL